MKNIVISSIENFEGTHCFDGNGADTDCQNRIREAIKDIVFKYDDNDTVVCVTSGVNITAFIGLAYKIPASDNMPFPLVPSCSPIGFEIDKSCF